MLDKTKKPGNSDSVPEEGEARHSDPITSKEAAASVDAKQLVWLVYRKLRENTDRYRGTPGEYLTYFQIAKLCNRPYSSITPRGKWLVEQKLIDFIIKPGLNAQGNLKNLMHFRALPPPKPKV